MRCEAHMLDKWDFFTNRGASWRQHETSYWFEGQHETCISALWWAVMHCCFAKLMLRSVRTRERASSVFDSIRPSSSNKNASTAASWLITFAAATSSCLLRLLGAVCSSHLHLSLQLKGYWFLSIKFQKALQPRAFQDRWAKFQVWTLSFIARTGKSCTVGKHRVFDSQLDMCFKFKSKMTIFTATYQYL